MAGSLFCPNPLEEHGASGRAPPAAAILSCSLEPPLRSCRPSLAASSAPPHLPILCGLWIWPHPLLLQEAHTCSLSLEQLPCHTRLPTAYRACSHISRSTNTHLVLNTSPGVIFVTGTAPRLSHSHPPSPHQECKPCKDSSQIPA